MTFVQRLVAGAAGLALAACGTETDPPFSPADPPAVELGCASVTSLALAAGQHAVVDTIAPAACIRLDNTPNGAEYVAVLYSAAPAVVDGGVSGAFRWRARRAGSAPSALRAAAPIAEQAEPLRLHDELRRLEHALPRPAPVARSRPAAPIPPPIGVGFQRAFDVCADLSCATTETVPATAAFVGTHVAVLLDDGVAPDAFSAADLTRLGRMLDEHVFPADTAAFGRESDVDGNGLIYLVITNQINRLCFDAGGVVTGYFFGRDLIPTMAGSNGAEVFFALAPDPQGNTGCRVTREFVERVLPPTFAHELQHMISYHQHVLSRQGDPEETWLNEGLSHLAEELAGRVVPNGFCVANDCFSQFSFNDVSNAYRYLEGPQHWYLLYPSGSTGRLAERGASYLLTRWLRDHFGNGHALTRRLVETGLTGAANVAEVTGQPFARLLGEWHLANYLDDLPDFTPGNARLGYTAWNWRVTFPSLRAQYPQLYPRSFPLEPDATNGSFDLQGDLRGGSGRFVRVTMQAGEQPADFRITGADDAAVPGHLTARLAIARIR